MTFVHPFAMWLAPEDREPGDWKSDPTRPFFVRAGFALRFGVGGWWGCVGLEIERPQ